MGQMKERFPRFREVEKRLRPDHPALTYSTKQAFLETVEHFLSLEGLRGFEEKQKQFLDQSCGNGTTNDGVVAWRAFCAEMEAIRLLGQDLGLRLTGFERESANSHDPGKTCDIAAIVNGRESFFEVKSKSAEEKQIPPPRLKEALAELKKRLPYDFTPGLLCRHYDCSTLGRDIDEIERHATNRLNLDASRSVPISFRNDRLEVVFHEKRRKNATAHYFDPDSVKDIRCFLLGDGAAGNDGKPMVPKVREVQEEKGADYLICRIPCWDPISDVAQKCFDHCTQSGRRSFRSQEQRLGQLRGVILFTDHANFCVVNNENSREPNWIDPDRSAEP